MQRPLHIWIIFLACFGLLLSAIAWVGWHTLGLEKEREAAAHDAEQQERVRLALWRLDFQASALMIRENARPPHDFRPFHAPEGLVNKSYDNVMQGEVLVPSPLLAEVPEHVLLHFQMDSRGQVVSPQVPQSGERTLALAQFLQQDVLQRSEQRLHELRALLTKPAAAAREAKVPQADASALNGFTSSRGLPLLNRQMLAEAANAAQFDFEGKEVPVGNDAAAPRNPAWTAPAQVGSVQTVFNSLENASRSRVVNAQVEEAVKQQQVVRMKELPVPKPAALAQTKTAVAGKKESAAYLRSDSGALTPNAQPAKSSAEGVAESGGGFDRSALAAAPAPAAVSAPMSEVVPPALVPAAPAAGALPGLQSQAAATLARDAKKETSSKPFQGVWLDGHLVLTREAWVDGVRMIQGVWLDWPALHSAWLREIRDLFPAAQLVPAPIAGANSRPSDDPLRFAALPLRLVPGAIALPPLPFWTPLRKSLGIAVACVLLAGAAVGLVLFGTVTLSERRAAFVSAVTHELRTPLTTFRLYSEMLADGMVQDEAQRRTYLDTLTAEAGRLSHLVENVLAYARLERGSARARAEHITMGALLDRVLPRLQQRAEACGSEVKVHASAEDRQLVLHVDAAAVEQILFNLVDNACKYAVPRASEPIIHVEAATSGGLAMLRVRDHGAGISRGERRRIFRPFHKSADQAAHSAPGVGLGLALCRRLAVALGGSITLDAAQKEGACFVLRLPK